MENNYNLSTLKREIINRGYLSCKNNTKYDIVDSTSFKEEPLNEEKINYVYEKFPQLKIMDEKFLKEGNYVIGLNVISKHRLLKNLGNYKGKGDAFIESLRYNSYTKDIDEVISTLSALEMGDESVNLSEGIQHNR